LRYAETARFGADSNEQAINPSASLAYSNGRHGQPFRLDYGGGYTWEMRDTGHGAGYFQRFRLAQGFTGPGWSLEASDDVSYRHQAPITGFSGIPGTGEPIVNSPVPPLSSAETVLTLDTRVLNNITQGDFSKLLGRAVSVHAGTSYSLLSYPDGNNIDNRGFIADAGMEFRLSARHDLNSSYTYSRFAYPERDAVISADALMAGYHREWTRTISSSVAAGPEWIRSSPPPAEQAGSSRPVPSSTQLSVQADLRYANHFRSAGLNYSRGVMAGGGYLHGGRSDQFSGSFSEVFARKLTLELVCGYRTMSELTSQKTLSNEAGSVQASWRLGRRASFYASYTAASQSSNSPLPANLLSSIYQVVSFGIGYSRQIGPSH
jgi:hypothetical protein